MARFLKSLGNDKIINLDLVESITLLGREEGRDIFGIKFFFSKSSEIWSYKSREERDKDLERIMEEAKNV